MQPLSLVIALAALGIAGWTYLERPAAPSTEVASPDQAALLARLEALSEELRALRERPALLLGSPSTSGPGLVAPERGEAATGGARAIGSVEERLARLETWQEKREEERIEGGAAVPGFARMQNRILADAASAQAALDLSASQRADLDRILEDTQLEIDRLADTPDEDGKTLRSLQEDTGVSIGEGGHIDMSKMLANVGKVMAFKERNIPGRNETYAAAEQRIRADAKRRIRESLTDEQRRTFDRSHTDPLIPRAGSGSSFSFAVSTDITTEEEGQ